VIVELERKYQANPAALDILYVRSLEGKLVPLSTVSRFNRSVGPLTITHSAQLPSVMISFSLAKEKSLGDALKELEDIARSTLPASITGSVQGTAQAFESSFRGLWVLLLVAILVIYIVLGILYESFVHPLTILSGLPSAVLEHY
jgi:HAE1 family hydrophobic/amphiphilic exporter-1